MELKLFNNWQEEAEQKNGKDRVLNKRKIKKIVKLIASAQVLETTSEYTIYNISNKNIK